jgi:2-phospho-L-lactate guanylyltransferase
VTPWLVVPIKGPSAAKSRLTPAVDSATRRQAAEYLAARTLGLLATGPWPVVVVTGSPDVAALAATHGCRVLPEAGASHSAAARQGAAWAGGRGADLVLALAADLPLLTVDDVRSLARRAAPGTVVLAPDRLGLGTNAVAAPPDFPFTFGAPSLARHAAVAGTRGLAVTILRVPGLAVDLDTPWDMDLLPTFA